MIIVLLASTKKLFEDLSNEKYFKISSKLESSKGLKLS